MTDELEDFEISDTHDGDTCPNCMKWGMLGILDYMMEQLWATGILVNDGGVYTFTAEEWQGNFKTMREFVDMLEAATNTVYTGTPFPWDKYGGGPTDD